MARKTMGLGDILIQGGLLTEDQLKEALTEQRETRERLGEILVNRGWITEDDVTRALGGQLGYEIFDPTKHPVEPGALELVPVDIAQRFDVLP